MTEAEWLTSTDPQAMLEFILGTWCAARGNANAADRKLRLFVCACCRQVWHLLTDEHSRRAVEVAERFADGQATRRELAAADQDATRAAQGHENSPLFAPAWVAHQTRFLLSAERQRFQNGPHFDRGAGATQAALLRDIFGNPWNFICKDLSAHSGTVKQIGAADKGRYLRFRHEWLTWHDGIIPRLAQAAYDERADRVCKRCKGEKVDPQHIGSDGHRRNCFDCHGAGTISDGTLDPDRLAVLADALGEAGCTDEYILRHLRGWNFRMCCEGGCVGEWVRSDAPHVRGCWVLDLLLGKE